MPPVALINPASTLRHMLTGAQSRLVSWGCCARQGHVSSSEALAQTFCRFAVCLQRDCVILKPAHRLEACVSVK